MKLIVLLLLLPSLVLAQTKVLSGPSPGPVSDGWHLVSSNNVPTWSQNAGAATNVWIKQIINFGASSVSLNGANATNYTALFAGLGAGVANGVTNRGSLLPTTGYMSNLTFCMVPGFPSTTNFYIAVMTNSITGSSVGATYADTPFTMTLTGVNASTALCTNSGTLSFQFPTTSTIGFLRLTNSSVLNGTPAIFELMGSWEWWHQSP